MTNLRDLLVSCVRDCVTQAADISWHGRIFRSDRPAWEWTFNINPDLSNANASARAVPGPVTLHTQAVSALLSEIQPKLTFWKSAVANLPQPPKSEHILHALIRDAFLLMFDRSKSSLLYNEKTAASVADRYLEALKTSNEIVECVVGLHGFLTDVPSLQVGPFKILRTDQNPRYLQLILGNDFWVDPDRGINPFGNKAVPFVLTFEHSMPRGEAWLLPHLDQGVLDKPARDFLTALRILQEGDVGFDEVRLSLRSPWHVGAISFFGYSGKLMRGRYGLKSNSVDALSALLTEVSGWTAGNMIEPPGSIALDRFNRSCERGGVQDTLLDLVIALEALCGDSPDISYKCSLRAARAVAGNSADAKATYDFLRKIYGWRNKLVHSGSSDFSQGDIGRFRRIVATLIRAYAKHAGNKKSFTDMLDDGALQVNRPPE